MGVISTGSNPSFLLPGVTKAVGTADTTYEELYSKMFELHSSDRAYEEDAMMRGLGMASKKTEGDSITYDDSAQQWVKRYTHDTYATGFIITQEEMDDNKAPEIAAMRAKELREAHIRRKETVGANVLNNGFDSNFTGGDSTELLATDHSTVSGNQANELATAADLSEASLEQAIIDLRKTKDQRGNRIAVRPQMLIVPPDLEPTAVRLLESSQQPGTANNDVNFLKGGRIPKGLMVNPYLTDTDAWFVTTDISNGLKYYTRKDMEVEMDNDFDTANAKFKATSRYSFGWSNWRAIFGSPGA